MKHLDSTFVNIPILMPSGIGAYAFKVPKDNEVLLLVLPKDVTEARKQHLESTIEKVLSDRGIKGVEIQWTIEEEKQTQGDVK